jgi:Mg2+ and Co2+ transporter CorA
VSSTTIEVPSLSDGRPLFAFAFRGGLGQALCDFAEADIAAGNADFVWVHLDLRDAAAQAWLRGRPWPAEIVEMVAAPIQRGRLFNTPDLVYGHLRDFRDEPGAGTLQAGSLCVVASRALLVTGRRIPLLSVKELRRRVEARTALPASPFGLITEFFKALNDIGEGLLQQASERLIAMGSKVLKRNGTDHREDLVEMRRESILVARDMAYKRTAMLELARERPALYPTDEFDRFKRQIHRYSALVEDAQEYAEHCQFLLEGGGGNQPKPLYTHDVLGDIPAGNPDREHLGHERRRHSVQRQSERFLGDRWADSGSLRLGRNCPFPVQVQVILRLTETSMRTIEVKLIQLGQ